MAAETDESSFVPPPPRRVATGFADRWAEPAQAWQKCTLLSLDGGGVRGYWTLLVLNKLIEQIAYIEQNRDENVPVDEEAGHSFYPENWPKHVSRKISDEERVRIRDTERVQTQEFKALDANRRYLPCHYFDYICGSSTGSLIAIMLGRLRMTVRDCLHEYEALIPEIFGSPRMFAKLTWKGFGLDKYSTKRVERAFKRVSTQRDDSAESRRGYKRFASRKKVCKTFATSLVSKCKKGSIEPVRTRYLIRSYDHMPRSSPDGLISPLSNSSRVNTDPSQTGREPRHPARNINYGPAEPMEVWQVARAATAAPLFFKAFDGPEDPEDKTFNRFVDGGLHVTNNPTWEGVQEVLGLNGPGSLSVVLSIGTARTDENTGSSLRSVVTNILELGNNPQTVHEQVEHRAGAENEGFEYFRLNDPHGVEVAMDECQPRNTGSAGSVTFDKIRNHFYKWVDKREIANDLWKCAVFLVKQRRARSDDRAAWETFATGSEYRCRAQRCEDILSSRYELRDHMEAKHETPMTIDDKRIKAQRDVWCYQKEAE